jgi:hypothetical protein
VALFTRIRNIFCHLTVAPAVFFLNFFPARPLSAKRGGFMCEVCVVHQLFVMFVTGGFFDDKLAPRESALASGQPK